MPKHQTILLVGLSAMRIKSFFEVEIDIVDTTITINLATNLITMVKMLYGIKLKQGKLAINADGGDYFFHSKINPILQYN